MSTPTRTGFGTQLLYLEIDMGSGPIEYGNYQRQVEALSGLWQFALRVAILTEANRKPERPAGYIHVLDPRAPDPFEPKMIEWERYPDLGRSLILIRTSYGSPWIVFLGSVAGLMTTFAIAGNKILACFERLLNMIQQAQRHEQEMRHREVEFQEKRQPPLPLEFVKGELQNAGINPYGKQGQALIAELMKFDGKNTAKHMKRLRRLIAIERRSSETEKELPPGGKS